MKSNFTTLNLQRQVYSMGICGPPSQYSYLLQEAGVPNLGFYLTMCLFLNACLSFLFAAESLEEADERVETDAKQVRS